MKRKNTIKGWVAVSAAAAFFVAIRFGAAEAVLSLSQGREVSSDSRFYVYLSDHPFAVLTGENLKGPDYDAAVLTNYGPLMGPLIGPPIKLLRRYMPDFFAVRAFLVAWETLGLGAAYLALSRGNGSPYGSAVGPLSAARRREFLILAAVLPLGWMSTAVWAQDEILLAPFIFFAFVAAVRDRPAAAAWALSLGALCAKYFALAFVPAAWLVCRRRPRFAAWVGVGMLPLASYATYMKVVHGVIPFVQYDTGDVVPFTISIFSLCEYAATWLELSARVPWVAAASKFLLVGAILALTAKFYLNRRLARRISMADDVRAWAAFGAALLLFNIMGQPEYLSWYAYFASLALVVLFRGRALAAAAGAVAFACLCAWVWNSAAAVTNWAALPAGTAQTYFAQAVEASVGAGFVTAIKVAAAVLYLASLACVLAAALRRPRGAKPDLVELRPAAGLCSARK